MDAVLLRFAERIAFRSLPLMLLAVLLAASSATGQTISTIPDGQWVNRYPKKPYYQGLQRFREGDLKTATEAFLAALAECPRDADGFWIDAIPVQAMLGECFYQAGDLPRAVSHINAALSIAGRRRSWLEAMRWPQAHPGTVPGSEMRALWIEGPVSPVMMWAEPARIAVGEAKVRRGSGGVPLSTLAASARVDAIEILRGASVAAYRRRVILGEFAGELPPDPDKPTEDQPQADQPPTARARTLLDAVEHCRRFAQREDAPIDSLEAAASIDGAIHPLSPVLYLIAARQAIEQNDFAAAASAAGKAAEAASLCMQDEYVAEAMLLAVGCSDTESAGQWQERAAAAAVGHLPRGRLAAVGALLAAAEAALVDEDTRAADTFLQQAGRLLRRQDMLRPRLAAHADYLAARYAARLGQSFGGSQPTAVDEAITRLLEFAHRRVGSSKGSTSAAMPRLHQMNLALAASRQRGADPAANVRLLGRVTSDPPTWMWKADPVDAIAFHCFDRSSALAVQFESAVKRPGSHDLIGLSDAILRHRFLARLPLGGRLQQVRSIASADPQRLVDQAASLRKQPTEEFQRLIDLLAARRSGNTSGRYSDLLESLATEIALDRVALPAAAPRPPALRAEGRTLEVDHGLLVFVDVGGQFHGLLMSRGEVLHWTIAPSRTVAAELGKLLRAIGVTEVTAGARLDASQAWQDEAAKLAWRLVPEDASARVRDLERLTIVPDGVLWYLPFELLPLQNETSSVPHESASVRYCPTPGLAFDPVHAAEVDSIGLVAGKLFAPDDAAVNEKWIDRIADAADGSRRISAYDDDAQRPDRLPDVLAVFAEITPPPDRPLELSLTQPQRSRLEVSQPLHRLMRLPVHAPRRVYLPGFRTQAAATPLGDGSELFMPLIALHCCGVQDVLLSRWRVGGESTARLMEAMFRESPAVTTRTAWQQAVNSLRRESLDPQLEPLLVGKDAEHPEVSGGHPLFWAGYLLTAPFAAAAGDESRRVQRLRPTEMR